MVTIILEIIFLKIWDLQISIQLIGNFFSVNMEWLEKMRIWIFCWTRSILINLFNNEK